MTLTLAAIAARRRLPVRAGVLLSAVAVLAASLQILAFQSGPAAAEGPQVADFTLPNGLEVVVIPDHRTPVVTHSIWYKVGSADETPGKSGLAHFLEHLMFKGTAAHPAGQFSQWLATIGGQENASTSSDYTIYYQRVAKEFLPTVMEFEADRMTGLVLTDNDVLPERDVVLEEYNTRYGNSPESRFGVQVAAALYLNHPYGRPVIGWRHEIEQLNREDALSFYRRFYRPNDAVVVVAGDVTRDEVKALVDKTYGRVARVVEVPPRVRPREPIPVAVRQLTMADDRVAQSSLQRAYLVPSTATAKPGEAEALYTLAQLLGGGETSRLYRALVVEQGIAASASGAYSGGALDDTRFDVSATPLPGITFATLEAAIDAVIAEIADHGVSEAEFDRGKTVLIASIVYGQDNQATMASWYGSFLMSGESVEWIASWMARLRAVTREDVHNAARTWLDKRRSVTGYLVKELPGTQEKRS
jgi:zinc protease